MCHEPARTLLFPIAHAKWRVVLLRTLGKVEIYLIDRDFDRLKRSHMNG